MTDAQCAHTSETSRLADADAVVVETLDVETLVRSASKRLALWSAVWVSGLSNHHVLRSGIMKKIT